MAAMVPIICSGLKISMPNSLRQNLSPKEGREHKESAGGDWVGHRVCEEEVMS